MIKVQKRESISRIHLKKMFFFKFVFILELLFLDIKFIDTADIKKRSLDEQETMNDYQHQSFENQPEYHHENNQFNDDLENLNQFGQEVEDANLEKINYEIQSQAVKLNQLNDEPVYHQDPSDQGDHDIIEQTDIAYERPLITRHHRQEHYVRNPNYNSRYYNRNIDHRHHSYERHRERPQYQTYQNQPQQQQQQDQNVNSQTEEPQNDAQNDSQNSQNSQEDSQKDPNQTEEPQQQQQPNTQEDEQTTPQSNLTALPAKPDELLTNLPKNKYGIHNNIFVIQAACGKLKLKKNKDDNRNVEKPIRRVKRRKTKRNERKRKHKRKKAKKIILIEEHNYVPAYKEHR